MLEQKKRETSFLTFALHHLVLLVIVFFLVAYIFYFIKTKIIFYSLLNIENYSSLLSRANILSKLVVVDSTTLQLAGRRVRKMLHQQVTNC